MKHDELNDHVANKDEGLDDEQFDPEFDDFGDGWCVECGDPFHLDDTGGYNPPCSCGLHCRRCHENQEREDAEWDDDDRDLDEDMEP